jgi:hypothetical protein
VELGSEERDGYSASLRAFDMVVPLFGHTEKVSRHINWNKEGPDWQTECF